MLTETRGDIWILVRPGESSILATAWYHYPWSCSLFICMLVFVIWHVLPRMGPVWVGTPSVWRSQYRDHLRNAGGFLWKHNAGNELLKALQQDMTTRVANYRRQLQLPPDTDMAPLLARIAGLPEDRIRHALQGLPARHDSDLYIEQVRILQILRTTL